MDRLSIKSKTWFVVQRRIYALIIILYFFCISEKVENMFVEKKIIYEKKLKHSYFSNLYMNKKLQGTSFGFLN